MSWEAAITFVLGAEGPYANDPKDPGGETVWGLSRRAYPDLEPWPPTREQAIEIYKRDYWDANRCGELPPALGIAVFDTGVNQGVKTAAKMLQKVLRIQQDGVIGPTTLATAHSGSTRLILAQFLAQRAHRYTSTKGFDTYGLGWLMRVLCLHQTCLAGE